jgi:hypothetical protein
VQGDIFLPPASSGIFSIFMTADKFAFRKDHFGRWHLGFSARTLRPCEIKGDDTRGWMGAGVQAPNADVQFGGHFNRFERASDIACVFLQRVVCRFPLGALFGSSRLQRRSIGSRSQKAGWH